MSRQPSISARNASRTLALVPDKTFSKRSQYVLIAKPCIAYSRTYFARSALFTALASSLVGFGMTSAIAAADTTINSNATVAAEQPSAQATTTNIPLSSTDDNLDAFDNLYSNKTQNKLASVTAAELQQQAQSIQQQGYQMMTPEQIDRELAGLDMMLDVENNSENNNRNNSENSNLNKNNSFNAPIAMLDAQRIPIGLDPSLDATSLPAPTNLETLGMPQDEQDNIEAAETAEIMARPINVSDAVSSGRVDQSADITEQNNPEQALAQQQRNQVTGAKKPISDVADQASTGKLPVANNADDIDSSTSMNTNGLDAQNGPINPEDYLPDYQVATETEAVTDSIEQANSAKPRARNSSGLIKRTYNRLFNGGVTALPHVETTVYLQQAAAEDTPNSQPKLIEADDDIQPINNIKAALNDTTVQSVADFTSALPRLRQLAVDAAKAVGYYDVTLRIRQPSPDTLDVIIEKLGEPVIVDNRIVDIRGAGIEQDEFKTLEKDLPPQEGDVFNHRVYKNSKAALESLSNTYGYFDQYWLNKSVDIILPDNTADVSLVYDTGERYQFDEVVFFTYDEESGTLTRDPDKLPVELSLLQQLFDFKAGDPFYRPDITKFSNDLSATRYFNTVNVESILPPDQRSASSTLAFDNAPDDGSIDGDVSDDNVSKDDTSADNSTSSMNNNNANLADSTESRAATDARNKNTSSNSATNSDNDIEGNGINANSGASVDKDDIAPIEFEIDAETEGKLSAIKQKAERLSRLPNDRVLDEKTQETDSILGKISDSISKVAKKVFPDEERLIADENFIPPTLNGRKTSEEVLESKKVPLYVFVSSDKPRDAEVGLGYGTDTGVRATGKIDYNLINRKGYQAGTEVEVSRIKKNATVYASRPWKHPLNDKLEARLTYEEKIKDKGEGNFDLSVDTLQGSLSRNIRRESGWNQSYFIRYRLDDLEAGDNVDLGDLEAKFTSGKPEQKALLLGYGLNRSDTDNATNPTKGISQYYGIQVGSGDILSDTDMAIINAGVSGLYSFGKDNKHQVLGSLDTGYIWSDEFYSVPYELRFFAGGDQSIRGYDYESLSPLTGPSVSGKRYLTGGQILAVGSAEYNYEFKPGFRGAIFTDVGNAYDKDFDTDTKVGVGVGIRWASPVGVVRVDVAAGVTEDSIPVRLHFFIGSPL